MTNNLMILIVSFLFQSTLFGNTPQDRNAIRSMAGCYEVSFYFEETTSLQPDRYEVDPFIYRARGIEWVDLQENPDESIELQHILKIGPDNYLKHWRQKWRPSSSKTLLYQGNSSWAYRKHTPNKHLWTQTVYQVDDGPRYGCRAMFEHFDDHSSWACTTFSPLPRREFSRRSDYNLMQRGNTHSMHQSHWLHRQNNIKIIQRNEHKQPLAQEKGVNTYKKVDDSRCVGAKNYWSQIKPIWQEIRKAWTTAISQKSEFTIKSTVNEQKLWQALFHIASKYESKNKLTDKDLLKIYESSLKKIRTFIEIEH